MKSLKLLFIGSVAQAGLICEHPKLTKIQNEIKEIFGIYASMYMYLIIQMSFFIVSNLDTYYPTISDY